MGWELSLLRRPGKAVLRILYPPQCHGCGEVIAADSGGADLAGGLCPVCWRETGFITGPVCDCCGASLPGEIEDLAVCEFCHVAARPWQRGRASFIYAGAGKDMVLAFKHGDRPDLAPALGRWLGEAARPLILPDMLVVPVPLHPRRLLQRRYNQAALLAAQAARLHGLADVPDMLIRHRYSHGQDHLSVKDRFANVADSFRFNSRYQSLICGKFVLLVDDVMTSGATLSAAVSVLKAAGAAGTCITVLARTIKDA